MRPGYATTEFWMTAAISFMGLAVEEGWIGPNFPQQKIMGLVGMFLPVPIYAISRAITKWGFFRDWQADPNK